MGHTSKPEKKPWRNSREFIFQSLLEKKGPCKDKGQPNLRVFAAHREDLKASRMVTDQSKIRWTINTLKPFKLADTDGIVPALLQKGVDHLVTQLCHIFRACLAISIYPKPGGRIR
jgi:hypothetical protein